MIFMNIGFFSPTINKVGGGELVALNMIYALKTRKHRVVVYSAEKINLRGIKNFFGYEIHFDEVVTIGPHIFDPYSLQCIYPNLLRTYLFRFKCDLLIDTFSDAFFPWTDAVYFNKDPRVTRLPANGMKGQFFAPYKSLLNCCSEHAVSKGKKLMTCSKFAASNIESSIGLPVNVLYPPVSPFFKVSNNLHSKENTVVTVIRIAQDKMPETIPQIAKLLSDDYSFIIVGNCHTSNELRTLRVLQAYIKKLGVSKKVKTLINISREEQRETLRKAKVYLHPFVPYEAFGISVAEAMSAGCIPVVPDVGGLKEIVPNQLRYTSLEEAAFLIEESINNWSKSKVLDSVKTASRFSQANFCEEFLRIMKL